MSIKNSVFVPAPKAFRGNIQTHFPATTERRELVASTKKDIVPATNRNKIQKLPSRFWEGILAEKPKASICQSGWLTRKVPATPERRELVVSTKKDIVLATKGNKIGLSVSCACPDYFGDSNALIHSPK